MNKDILSIIENIKLQKATDIIYSGTVTSATTITVSGDYTSYDFTNRNISVDSPANSEGTYSIISWISTPSSTVFTVSGLDITDTSITGTILADASFLTICDNLITKLSSANTYTFTNFDFPIKNDWFNKFDEFLDILIQQKQSYKDENEMSTLTLDITNILSQDPHNMSSTQLNTYSTDLDSIITNISGAHEEWEAYFKRVKRVITNISVSDFKIESQDWENFYNAKSTEDKSVIDNLYNEFTVNGYEQYSLYKQTLLYDIKI